MTSGASKPRSPSLDGAAFRWGAIDRVPHRLWIRLAVASVLREARAAACLHNGSTTAGLCSACATLVCFGVPLPVWPPEGSAEQGGVP